MDNPNIEQQISTIEQQVLSQLPAEQGPANFEHPEAKERLHETVGKQIQQAMPTPPPTPAPIINNSEDPSYLQPEYKDQVQDLINIAFHQSIHQAIQQVASTSNPGLIDAFHDALVDELYSHLIERGKLAHIK
jgi:hypothetical protein